MSSVRVQNPCFHLIEISETLTSTSGVHLDRAPHNEDCCLTNSISTSEDGTYARWPIVVGQTLLCGGNHRKTYQQWIDYAAQGGYGLCFEGWLYIVRGIYVKGYSDHLLSISLQHHSNYILDYNYSCQ